VSEGAGMSEAPRERKPDGTQEARTSEAGEPSRGLERDASALEEERPDLDERQSRISTRRKPMGPPIEALEEAVADLPREAAPELSPEPPTDPTEP